MVTDLTYYGSEIPDGIQSMTITQQFLMDKERVFLGKVENICPGLLEKSPIAPYVAELQNKDPLLSFDPFSESLVLTLDQIKAEHGQASLALYHKISLCRLMRDFLSDPGNDRFPASVHRLYELWFDRITQDFRTQPDSYYDIDRPLWPLRKDISVCSGRSIPVGGAFVVERKLVARRAIIRRARRRRRKDKAEATRDFTSLGKNPAHGLTQQRIFPAARRIVQAARRVLGGCDLCYMIHTVERDIQDFNEEQMNVAYGNIAKLLKSDRNTWGVHRASWFLDPAVGEISPSMGFLLQVPLNSGAKLHNNGPCSDDEIRKATMLSPDRSRLFQSGDYVPRNYFYFWSRDRIIETFGKD